jgi:hypothetical protein
LVKERKIVGFGFLWEEKGRENSFIRDKK